MTALTPRYVIQALAWERGIPSNAVDKWLQCFSSEEVKAMAADRSKSYLNLLITFYDNISKRRQSSVRSGATPAIKSRARRRPVRQQGQPSGPRHRGSAGERTAAPTAGTPEARGATPSRGRPCKYRAAQRRTAAPRGSAAIHASAIAGTTAASGTA